MAEEEVWIHSAERVSKVERNPLWFSQISSIGLLVEEEGVGGEDRSETSPPRLGGRSVRTNCAGEERRALTLVPIRGCVLGGSLCAGERRGVAKQRLPTLALGTTRRGFFGEDFGSVRRGGAKEEQYFGPRWCEDGLTSTGAVTPAGYLKRRK